MLFVEFGKTLIFLSYIFFSLYKFLRLLSDDILCTHFESTVSMITAAAHSLPRRVQAGDMQVDA